MGSVVTLGLRFCVGTTPYTHTQIQRHNKKKSCERALLGEDFLGKKKIGEGKGLLVGNGVGGREGGVLGWIGLRVKVDLIRVDFIKTRVGR